MGYGLGTVLFDTKTCKGITPGQWRKKDGPALKGSIRWWDFLNAEEEKRSNCINKKYEIRYDKNRRRIKSDIPDKGTKPRKDPRDVPILPYPGRLPRVNRTRNVSPKKGPKLN